MSRFDALPPWVKRTALSTNLLLTIVPAVVVFSLEDGMGVTPVGLPTVSAVLTLATWPVYIWDLLKRHELRYRLAAYAVVILASAVAFVAWQLDAEARGRAKWSMVWVALVACQVRKIQPCMHASVVF
ncbi:hypothetical protein DFJ77DRAFT_283362, partial [Powellomyces hirtus]